MRRVERPRAPRATRPDPHRGAAVNPSALFIRRPVATTLLTLGIMLVGIAAYFALPVASLPSVDFPTIQVSAALPGASPVVMATSVATPLERRLGQIADVAELTSNSSTGRTNITVQFGLDRNIDGAARDVQAAISASRGDLPTTLRSNPTYNKQNPANAPIMILALTSPTLTNPQIYDAVSLTLGQKLAQVQGVGEADIQGATAPAVRVELNPQALSKYGIALEDVRAAINGANANQPKGMFSSDGRRRQIYTNDQARTAAEFAPLVVAFRNGAAVRLQDVARVYDGAENDRILALFNGKPAIVVRIQASPGANIVATVDRIKAVLPQLQAQLPPTVDLNVALDRTTTIRGSITEVERTLLISIVLVVLVVLVFLRNGRATLIPAVAVVSSLLGTLAVMWLLRFSLDNLSLMALTVATGFVVDDAIVVLENITRHVEEGVPRFKAALIGAGEVGFTVVSMSISLIAVFLPILLMGGIVGKLFREFAMTLSAAILISLVVSLTATPTMAARLIDERPEPGTAPTRRGRWNRFWGGVSDRFESAFDWMVDTYEGSLVWALDHGRIVLVVLLGTVALNVYLYTAVPKGFFPQQDSGVLQGGIQVDQASSFDATAKKFRQLVGIVGRDKAVDSLTAFTFGGSGGFMFLSLKPRAQRPGETADMVINRIRPRTAKVSGAQLFLQSAQDFRFGGRQSAAQYQYVLQSDDLDALKTWADKLTEQLKKHPELTDVNSDQQEHGLETYITVDREAAARLGVTSAAVDNVLNDAFSQRLAAVIYNPLNTYHVVMEVAPRWGSGPTALDSLYVQPGSDAVYSGAAPVVGSAASAERLSATAFAANQAIAQGATRPSTVVSVVGGAAANSKTGTIAGPSGAATTVSASSNGAASTGAGSATSSGSSTGATGSGSPLNGAGTTRSTTGGATQAQTGSAIATTVRRAIPLSAIASYAPNSTATSISHQGQSVATTLSFNLAPGQSLSTAQSVIAQAQNEIQMPNTVTGAFGGTAQVFQDTLKNQPLLILAALVAVYIVLGVLYESYIHPITVLSTLPSAGIGALLALMLLHMEFDIIALIGVILLIGIVKKNAILIIDFALVAERDRGLSSYDAIYEASLLRFRPILMTTMAAILGALPLAIGFGEGGELRRPLGVAIVGGLIASQVLTLITTPVVYLYMDKLRRPSRRRKGPERWTVPSPDPALSPGAPPAPARG